MQKNKMPIVEAKGTNYEIGIAIGKACKSQIRRQIKTNKRYYKLKTKVPYETYVEKGMAFLEPCIKYFPQYVEELKGISHGSGVKFEDVFMFSVEEELVHVANEIPVTKCTTVATKTKDNSYVLGHNEDYGAEYKDGLYLIKAKQKGNKPDFISIGYMGTLPGSSIALNSKGIAFSGNSVNSHYLSLGVPKNFLLRSALDAHTVKSAVKRLCFKHRAIGNNSVIINKDGIYSVETSNDKAAVLKSKKYFVHTNHYLHPKFYSHHKRKIGPNSARRLDYAMSKLEIVKVIDEDTVKSILSNHRSLICCHALKKTSYMTIASSIAIPDKGILKVTKGNPCKKDYVEYKL